MRNGFIPTPREIDVPECFFVGNTEVRTAFWRDVYVAVAGEGGCCDPEHFLGEGPGLEGGGDGFVVDAHLCVCLVRMGGEGLWNVDMGLD